MKSAGAALVASVIGAVGCGDGVTSLDLGAITGGQALVGVSIDPVTSERYVLDAELGIFAVENGAARRVWDAARVADYGLTTDSRFTDLAALGDGRFALTARNEGFLLDLSVDALALHFCYVPGSMILEEDPPPPPPEEEEPEEEIPIELEPVEPVESTYEQLTNALTYDAERDLLLAQPRTFDEAGAVLLSHVALFDRASGYEQAWFRLDDPQFFAGAIAKRSANVFLLARGSDLFAFRVGVELMTEVRSLGELGVERVEGMAVDTKNQTVLLLDGATGRLLEGPVNLLDP